MTALNKALARLLREIEALSALQRCVLVRTFGEHGEAIQPLVLPLRVLLCMPAPSEERQILAALVDAARGMSSTARRAIVDVTYGAELDAGYARGLFDALGAVVGLVDAQLDSAANGSIS